MVHTTIVRPDGRMLERLRPSAPQNARRNEESQRAHRYVLVPDALILAFAHDPLAVGVYVAIARFVMAAKDLVPLAARDLAAWMGSDREADRVAIMRRISKLEERGWLMISRTTATKHRLLPTWGRDQLGTVRPWRLDQADSGRPSHVRGRRVPLGLLDDYVGRLDPQAGQAHTLISRYFTRPLLDLSDIGVYTVGLRAEIAPTPRLAHLGLHDLAGMTVPLDAQSLIELAAGEWHELLALQQTYGADQLLIWQARASRVRMERPYGIAPAYYRACAARAACEVYRPRTCQQTPSSLAPPTSHIVPPPSRPDPACDAVLQAMGVRERHKLSAVPYTLIAAWQEALAHPGLAAQFMSPIGFAVAQMQRGNAPPPLAELDRRAERASRKDDRYESWRQVEAVSIAEAAITHEQLLEARVRAIAPPDADLADLCELARWIESGATDAEALAYLRATRTGGLGSSPGSIGPLQNGELERAATWARALANVGETAQPAAP